MKRREEKVMSPVNLTIPDQNKTLQYKDPKDPKDDEKRQSQLMDSFSQSETRKR